MKLCVLKQNILDLLSLTENSLTIMCQQKLNCDAIFYVLQILILWGFFSCLLNPLSFFAPMLVTGGCGYWVVIGWGCFGKPFWCSWPLSSLGSCWGSSSARGEKCLICSHPFHSLTWFLTNMKLCLAFNPSPCLITNMSAGESTFIPIKIPLWVWGAGTMIIFLIQSLCHWSPFVYSLVKLWEIWSCRKNIV